MARRWLARVHLHAVDGPADHRSLHALRGDLLRIPGTALRATPRPWDPSPTYRRVGSTVEIMSRRPYTLSPGARRAARVARRTAQSEVRAQRVAAEAAASAHLLVVRGAVGAAHRACCAVRLFVSAREDGTLDVALSEADAATPEVASATVPTTAAAASAPAASTPTCAPATIKAGKRRRMMVPRSAQSTARDVAVAAALNAAAQGVVAARASTDASAHIGAARNIRARVAADAAAASATPQAATAPSSASAAMQAPASPAVCADSPGTSQDAADRGEARGAAGVSRGPLVRRSARLSTRHDTEGR